MDSLVAGTVVQFNVIASNGVGDSKPSDTSPMYFVVGKIMIFAGKCCMTKLILPVKFHLHK